MERLRGRSWMRANMPHAFLCAAVRCQSVAVNELFFQLPPWTVPSHSSFFFGLLGCSTMTIRPMASSSAAAVLYRHFLSFWLSVFPFPWPTIHKRTNCLKINFVGRCRRRWLLLYQLFFRLDSCRFSCLGFSSLCGFVKAFASRFISIGILALA